jgi:hypothetical protein
MEHLKKEGFTTLALRGLEPYLESTAPADPLLTVRYRPPKDGQLALTAGSRSNTARPDLLAQ